ncbi:RING finger protein 141-like [Bombus flavifrons]|uniref:RING finger protein 141-like n=1 Tax=Bombus flavifrons TaxID=103934 RepID=UPI00370418D3
MPHAGFVTVLIGVTVATVLYFMFGTNKPRTAQQYYEHAYEYHSERPNRLFDSEECSICLLPLINRATYILPCKHQFHKNCIDKWRHQAQEHRALCPLCRSPFT